MPHSADSPNPRPPAAPGDRLARRLRAMRKERAWSLDRAAAETGVSKAMLGQIERGESSPTVACLWKIATGFQCSLSGFLVEWEPQTSDALFRTADSVRDRPASDDMLVAPLFPFEKRFGFEWLELTLLPGYVRQSEPHAPGVTEHLAVVQGAMEVCLAGEWKALKAGEAVRFAGDRAHGYRNLNADKAVCHNLIHYAAPAGAA
ncbi:helix-turn-helix domain-containing protein [Paludibacterium yongneupense]|uniref:helix-turn-helix domain-containing protein n=1 Tax=Paludibacterium yongneupense TaxID=400061 RepID=UPI00041A15D7|nr:helix-turn-helix domain-containing protein [Paludibacterium yongneupense]